MEKQQEKKYCFCFSVVPSNCLYKLLPSSCSSRCMFFKHTHNVKFWWVKTDCRKCWSRKISTRENSSVLLLLATSLLKYAFSMQKVANLIPVTFNIAEKKPCLNTWKSVAIQCQAKLYRPATLLQSNFLCLFCSFDFEDIHFAEASTGEALLKKIIAFFLII